MSDSSSYLSVVLSREEVASSKIIRLGFLWGQIIGQRYLSLPHLKSKLYLMRVLAMATLCLSPPDSFTPRSPTIVSYCKKGHISGCPNHNKDSSILDPNPTLTTYPGHTPLLRTIKAQSWKTPLYTRAEIYSYTNPCCLRHNLLDIRAGPQTEKWENPNGTKFFCCL